ncbi:MAG: 2Fe-2S iron-sulfur cluster binding domain-containing protein [Holophaga sp.]|nr:2Fe-2S iron-sulfur cluster binding domain-containing protein [Holophaga sp.]
MPTLKINDIEVKVEPGTLLLDACAQAGYPVPSYCYHSALTPVATCRMCLVEIKGQPKLATSCTTMAGDGQEVFTNSKAVADGRAGVMEFLLINHPLDCPICDQAGECKLQDYSYQYGSGDSRMAEPKRRYRYEDLGAKIVIDKNRCIHCTRCVRFTKEISGTGELIVANRGSELEVTTYSGRTMDENPLAGNVVDLCPVGALTSRDFRFNKRVWYLKPVPTISRHSPMANPIWADVDQNRLWRFRPRPEGTKLSTQFMLDAERLAWHRYDLDPAGRLVTPLLGDAPATAEAIAARLREAGSVAVAGQGTFGCDAAQRLGDLASSPDLRYGTGDRLEQVQFPALQPSSDGIFNRRGFSERGFRFGHLDELLARVRSGEVKAVVLLHDAEFSSRAETAKLAEILEAVPFSLLLEPIPSGLRGSARLPVATYLEESDFVINHEGELRRYQKALEPPRGVKPLPAWARELAGAIHGASV